MTDLPDPVSKPTHDCDLIKEGDGLTCPAGLPVPRGTVLTRRVLRSVTVLVILALLVTAANLLFTAHQITADDHKFCGVVQGMTALPVPRPADPKANPSRELSYEWYLRFVQLGRDLGCKG